MCIRLKSRIRIQKLLKEGTQRLEREKEEYERFISNSLKNGTRIIGIKKIEERKIYDTRWLITFQGMNGVEDITVVRYDMEVLHGVCVALDVLGEHSRESIGSLDERNEIYYD